MGQENCSVADGKRKKKGLFSPLFFASKISIYGSLLLWMGLRLIMLMSAIKSLFLKPIKPEIRMTKVANVALNIRNTNSQQTRGWVWRVAMKYFNPNSQSIPSDLFKFITINHVRSFKSAFCDIHPDSPKTVTYLPYPPESLSADPVHLIQSSPVSSFQA